MPDLFSCGLPGYNAAFPQNQSEGSRQFLVIHMLSNGQFDLEHAEIDKRQMIKPLHHSRSELEFSSA